MAVSTTAEIIIIIFLCTIMLFGVYVGFRYIIIGKICPTKRRSANRTPSRDDRDRTEPARETTTTQSNFEATAGPNEAPPSYEWVNEHGDVPTLAFVDSNGRVRYVKWDGTGPVPTRTAVGFYHEAMTRQFQREQRRIESQTEGNV